jgi:hypothetical protein
VSAIVERSVGSMRLVPRSAGGLVAEISFQRPDQAPPTVDMS